MSGPRTKGIPLGRDAKGIKLLSGEKIAFEEFKSIIRWTASSRRVMTSGAIDSVPLCLDSTLKMKLS